MQAERSFVETGRLRTEISLSGFAIVARAWILSLRVKDCLNGGAKKPGDRYQPITTTYYIGNSSCSFERKHTIFFNQII